MIFLPPFMRIKPFSISLKTPLLWSFISIFILFMLAGCAFNRIQKIEAPLYFVGRLALNQDANPNIPGNKADSWSAHFELAGSPEKGTLLLYTPVGTVVAQVSWEPGLAVVKTSDTTEHYNSLNQLSSTYFQQEIPIAALFDWLLGKPTQQVVPGWNVNLARATDGIISAERHTPAPRVRLRAVIDDYEERDTTTP